MGGGRLPYQVPWEVVKGELLRSSPLTTLPLWNDCTGWMLVPWENLRDMDRQGSTTEEAASSALDSPSPRGRLHTEVHV